MEKSSLDYTRFLYLNQQVKDNTASQAEKDEYMYLLFQNGNITQQQYDNYLSKGKDSSDDVVKAAITIGGILLVTYLLSKLFDNGK